MKWRRQIIRTLFVPLLLLSASPAAVSQVANWKQIVIPPLPAFHPQQPKRIELANGMVIFLQPDHELPFISGRARIRGGSREEPAAKTGLASIYGRSWRTGGTTTQTGDALDDYLESRAAQVETFGGLDSTSVSWDCLKGDFDDVFKVVVDVLRHPEFREDKIALAKRQIDTGIARRNDDSSSIAAREAAMLGYGKDSPYARIPEYSTVAAVTRDDLVAWHKTYVRPNNIILGVTGDFDPDAMEAKLKAAFDSWQRGPALPKFQAAIEPAKPGIYFVEKDDVNQSEIQMVELGTRRDNPDFYAIEVLNELFGGSFASRLVEDIRTKRGLAYEVGGGIGTSFDHPGLVRIDMGTKSGTTVAAIQALDEDIDGLKKNPPTTEELKKSKDDILNSFIFEFDSKSKVLAERMGYEFYGYPADFLERYREGIEKVTKADVERVAEKYIHKDRLAVLVVGKASDFDKPLATLGKVTTLDITIPPLNAGQAAAPAASNEEGKGLIAKIVEGLGGAEKVNSVKSVRAEAKLYFKSPQGDWATTGLVTIVYPDHLMQQIKTPRGEPVTMVASPTSAFAAAPEGTRDLPGWWRQDMLDDIKRDPIYLAQHADDPKFVFSASGTEKIGGVEAAILDISGEGASVRWFVDPATGRLLRARWQSTGPQGPLDGQTDYSDWRAMDGVTLPFKQTTTGNGVANSEEMQKLEINPAVDMKIFEKPAAKEPGGAHP
jgi:zinc protease